MSFIPIDKIKKGCKYMLLHQNLKGCEVITEVEVTKIDSKILCADKYKWIPQSITIEFFSARKNGTDSLVLDIEGNWPYGKDPGWGLKQII